MEFYISRSENPNSNCFSVTSHMKNYYVSTVRSSLPNVNHCYIGHIGVGEPESIPEKNAVLNPKISALDWNPPIHYFLSLGQYY